MQGGKGDDCFSLELQSGEPRDDAGELGGEEKQVAEVGETDGHVGDHVDGRAGGSAGLGEDVGVSRWGVSRGIL